MIELDEKMEKELPENVQRIRQFWKQVEKERELKKQEVE